MYQRKKLKRFLKKCLFIIQGCPVNDDNLHIFHQYDRRWNAFHRAFRKWLLFLNPDTKVTIKDTGLEVMKIIEEVKHDAD